MQNVLRKTTRFLGRLTLLLLIVGNSAFIATSLDEINAAISVPINAIILGFGLNTRQEISKQHNATFILDIVITILAEIVILGTAVNITGAKAFEYIPLTAFGALTIFYALRLQNMTKLRKARNFLPGSWVFKDAFDSRTQLTVAASLVAATCIAALLN